MTLTLTDRDLELLDVLTLRVRLLTLRQVTELWWPNGENQRCIPTAAGISGGGAH